MLINNMSNVKEEYDPEWNLLLDKLTKIVGKRPNLDAILFLIGIQELGQGKKTFSKEEKQDLMHIAVCKLLSQSGYYELEGLDKEGWPHWKLIKKLPKFDLNEQEKLLKIQIKEYFSDYENFNL
jgi:hypothetical protein